MGRKEIEEEWGTGGGRLRGDIGGMKERCKMTVALNLSPPSPPPPGCPDIQLCGRDGKVSAGTWGTSD